MKQPRIGLLPLYLELYDRLAADHRPAMEAFCRKIERAFAARGVGVRTASVCRLNEETTKAVRAFERADVDAVVTLHLAYSPSLESAPALADTPLPLIVLDTTPAFEFGPGQDPAEIMYNHGIHGVQDLCNLLIRRGKPFLLEVGHWQRSDVLDRVIGHLPAARMARRLATSRVGLIGKPFAGMGDFSVSPACLRREIGARIVTARPRTMQALVEGISGGEVRREMAEDARRFDIRGLNAAAHERSARAGLALRRWIADEGLTALTMNFGAAGSASGLPVMPFLELSKAMARGVGYAGEGDVLTATLVGALASVFPATTFTEMFCPDWKGDRVFLSHMGEFNLDLADRKPLLAEPKVNFTPGESPVVPYGRLRGGAAAWVNLAPMPGDRFRLILAPGRIEAARGKDRFTQTVRGWFRSKCGVAEFLGQYSRFGGTHHSALVYGAGIAPLKTFALFAGLEAVVIE